MIAAPLLASLDFNSFFWGIVFWGVLIGGNLLLARFLSRKKTSGHPTTTTDERLQKLDSMRNAGSITDGEYQEQRRRILSEV
jgi:hypothetical protein